MNQASVTVKCPRCGKPVQWHAEKSPFRPFCSERCKLIDLGAWAEEKYRVAQKEGEQEPDGIGPGTTS